MQPYINKLKRINWSKLRHLGAIGIIGLIMKNELRFFFLFYLLGFLERNSSDKMDEKQSNDQKAADLKRYYLSQLYSQFNSATIVYSSLQLFGHLLINARYKANLPDAGTYQNKCAYSLPFNESWTALNGGSRKENSHSWNILTQRYAYDFVICDEKGSSFKNNGKTLEDYYCYGKAILSPADGTVVKTKDGIRDYEAVGDYSFDWKTKDFRGNFVVIRHADREYSFLAHLKKGSLCVREGQLVKAGEQIGLCGNSGHSTEPHLHFHLQDSANFWFAAGLPVRFKSFLKTPDKAVYSDQFVERGEAAANILNQSEQ